MLEASMGELVEWLTTVAPMINARNNERKNKTPVVPVSQSRTLLPPNEYPTRAVDERGVALANLQHLQFELHKTVGELEKESDGGSKTIPKFRMIVEKLESYLAKLQTT